MQKKTINLKEASFTQAINISAIWCKEWEEDILSDEVLADRIGELIKTKAGLRGFFAYSLSDAECSLLDRLPSSLIFMLIESGNNIVEIVVKNLVMSSAQIIIHANQKNLNYKASSEKISERCKNILRLLNSNLVSKNLNQTIKELDNLGNSFDNSTKYDDQQKEFIKTQIYDIAQ